MLDVDNSGLLDFDEFYLLVCILLAVRVCISDLYTVYRLLHDSILILFFLQSIEKLGMRLGL